MTIRITYNSVNVDLDIGSSGLVINPVSEGSQNVAGSGLTESITHYTRFEYSFDAYFSDAVYYSLWGWWSWARQGKTWSFAMDSAKVGNTTLDAAAAAAQKVIPLTATAAFTAGEMCLIRAADNDDEFEVVEIDTISAGVSVTAVNNLVYSYTSGDKFTYFEYFPAVIMADGFKFNPKKEGSTWSMVFKFVEDKS